MKRFISKFWVFSVAKLPNKMLTAS